MFKLWGFSKRDFMLGSMKYFTNLLEKLRADSTVVSFL